MEIFYSLIVVITGTVIPLLWSLVSLPLLGYYILHRVTNSSTIDTILSKIKRGTYKTNGECRGWFVGKYYIGYIQDNEQQRILYIYCTETQYEKLTYKPVSIKSGTPIASFEIYERDGKYQYFYYTPRKLTLASLTPREDQSAIINAIIDLFKEKDHLVALINGNPGTGKSALGIFLSLKLKGSLCNTWNPTDPGDTLSKIYNTANPTQEKPLILVLEEFDVLIHKVHKNIVREHNEISTPVYNKTTWNIMFDKFDIGYYPHTILLLITNEDPSSIDVLDPSYLRKGRVTQRFQL
jgi:hypothetical protein